MRQTGDWSGARPLHFAAQYVAMHASVYGTRPDDSPAALRRSAMLAGNLLGYADGERRGAFAGDVAEMARYMTWLWRRELERHQWRLANGRDARRMPPQVAFSRGVVDDWRVEREGKRRARGA